MKRKIQLLVFLMLIMLVSRTTFAQQANIWHFGDHAGLDFTGTPTPFTGSAMSTNEGCASVCDNTGSLLFYTDGIKIWDASNVNINPGTPLRGNSSSTQSAVIIPKPGSTTRYFIFTQDEHGLGTCTYGLNYSEVDVTGGVVTLVTANTSLQSCGVTTEKITAACHQNGTDYWAVTVNQNGDFVSWPVTSAGVGTAVVTSGMASPTTGTDDMVGYMKVSRQGTHIVLARRQYNSISELFTFDNSTGIVTSNVGAYNVGVAYGVEFSSDGNYFYATLGFGQVEQYQVANIAVHTTLFTGGPIGALQLGPDGNIYLATGYENSNGNFLHMISNINSYPGTFNANYIALPAGTYSRLGLPDLVACFVPTEGCKVDAKFNFVYDPQQCVYNFTDLSTVGLGTNIVAWEWTFGDGTSSTLQNPSHRYTTPGIYNVCLTVYAMKDGKCCQSTFCEKVPVQIVCKQPCEIEPEFEWLQNNCAPCNFHFWAYTLFANTDVLAWMWDFGDGTTGTGQTIDHVYGAPGVYNVCLTVVGRPDAQGNCCTFKLCYQVQVNCGAANPPANKTAAPAAPNNTPSSSANNIESGFKAYPNPASTTVRVEFNVPANQGIKMQLVDYSGKKVWESANNNAIKGRMVKDIDISNISSGIYLLLIEGDNLKLTEKIQVVKN